MNKNYNPHLKHYARELRKYSVSKAEKYLWKALLSRKLTGFSFKRQRPIDQYIVDFYCMDLSLIIEIDGSSHLTKGVYDELRQDRLKQLGNRILRFSEGDVLNRFAEVEEKIRYVIGVLARDI